MRSTFVILGALLAALGVGLGAFGAHGLRNLVEQGRFSTRDLETFQTAVHYQMIHALGLILVGLLSNARPSAASHRFRLDDALRHRGVLRLSLCLRGHGREALRHAGAGRGAAFILAWLGVAAAAMRG